MAFGVAGHVRDNVPACPTRQKRRGREPCLGIIEPKDVIEESEETLVTVRTTLDTIVEIQRIVVNGHAGVNLTTHQPNRAKESKSFSDDFGRAPSDKTT